jgi:hypothetical protein
MHPAGSDEALAAVMADVHAGRWMGMADLLATAKPDHLTRCTRTLLLARLAAGGNAVEQWLRERPGDRNGIAMASRVAVERAVRAVGSGHPEASQLMRRAEAACANASEMDPADPVPPLGRLALACVRREYVDGPKSCPVPGPWHAVWDVWAIDPGNREACHRMMAAAQGPDEAPRPGDAQMFARIAGASPANSPGSPVRVLPLYALVSLWEHRHRNRPDELAHLLWTTPAGASDIELAWEWFLYSDPSSRLVIDLSHLAHALWASGQAERAVQVFDAMGRYGSPRPWETVSLSGDGTAELVRIRTLAYLARDTRPRASRSGP